MIDNPAGMWMEILIAYHVCISEWVNSWLCLAPYLCRSALPKNALLCAVFPKRERCMCTEVIRYSFLKWNPCVPLASEFESGTKIHFEISFFSSLRLHLDDVNSFELQVSKSLPEHIFLMALVTWSVFIFLFFLFFFSLKRALKRKKKMEASGKSYWGQLPFYNLRSLEKVWGGWVGKKGCISERCRSHESVSEFWLKTARMQCLW